MSEWMTESIHSWCSSLLLLTITLSGVIFMAGPNFYLQKACHFSEAQPNLPSSEGLLKFPCSPLVPVSQSLSPSVYVAYSYVLMFFFFFKLPCCELQENSYCFIHEHGILSLHASSLPLFWPPSPFLLLFSRYSHSKTLLGDFPFTFLIFPYCSWNLIIYRC